MKIKIKDRSVCENCTNRTCAFIDARIKEQFYSLRTETTVCPTGVLMDDTPSAANSHDYIEKNCVQCGLCVKSCCQNNLLVENGDNDIFDLSDLSEFQQNAIALSCLDNIMGFAANTNRNRSINFDGFAQNRKGESCFVEVDYGDDSLECCRRLIGDFITYEGNIGPIRNGLMVLKELPREGSRDVYGVLSKLQAFPTTQDCKIYFTTFDIIRHLMLNVNTENATLSELFCNPLAERVNDYEERITQNTIDEPRAEEINSIHPPVTKKEVSSSECFKHYLPLYTLRAACGYFIDHEEPEVEGWVDVTSAIPHPNKDMFVVHAKGNSMLPKIKDGDLCVFELYHGGSRNGEIVLTQLNERDYDYGGSYTIKKYHSEKIQEDGVMMHTKVELQPLNTDGYSAIEIQEDTSEDFTTIAILKCVL